MNNFIFVITFLLVLVIPPLVIFGVFWFCHVFLVRPEIKKLLKDFRKKDWRECHCNDNITHYHKNGSEYPVIYKSGRVTINEIKCIWLNSHEINALENVIKTKQIIEEKKCLLALESILTKNTHENT